MKAPKLNIRIGLLSMAGGIAGILGVVLIGFISVDENFNPHDWFRVASGWAFPIGVVMAVVFGFIARRRYGEKKWSMVGFILAGLAIVGFGIIIAAIPY